MNSGDSYGSYERYEVVYSCVQCETPLDFDEIMDSHGCCPYCGRISAGTIVDHKKQSRLIKYEASPSRLKRLLKIFTK